MEQVNGSSCYVDLLRKRVRVEEEEEEEEDDEKGGVDVGIMVSPSSLLPSTLRNGTIMSSNKFNYNGGKGSSKLSFAVSATVAASTPLVPHWYADMHPACPGEARLYEVEKVLFHGRSKYQELLVFESKEHGKVAILDGYIQLTETDEFAYQEMLTHLNLCSIPNPRKVLLIGGGDGGILREVSRHTSVEQIDIIELDQMIIDIYRKFFPDIAVGYEDPRVRVRIGDGVAFLKKVPQGTYDAIIVDAFADMGKDAVELNDEDLLLSIAHALCPGGVVSTPAAGIWTKNFSNMAECIERCRRIFGGSVNYAWTTVPSYTHGGIGFMLCSKKGPEVDFKNPINPLGPRNLGVANRPPKFYNSEIHTAAFCLPSFAKKATGSEVV